VFVKLAIGLSALSYGIINKGHIGRRLALIVLGLAVVLVGLPILDGAQ
jgi:hypothetical protein